MFCFHKGKSSALKAHIFIITHFLQAPNNYGIGCQVELPESEVQTAVKISVIISLIRVSFFFF